MGWLDKRKTTGKKGRSGNPEGPRRNPNYAAKNTIIDNWQKLTIQSESDPHSYELKDLQIKPRKKSEAWTRFDWTHDLRDTGAMLYQLSYETFVWKQIKCEPNFYPLYPAFV